MSDQGSQTYDNLIAGTQKNLVTRAAKIAPGLAFGRGQLLGRLTATGEYELVDYTNVSGYDGYGIACEAIASSPTETYTDVFTEGEFSENCVTFGYGDTADEWREILASGHGIYLRSTISTLGQ